MVATAGEKRSAFGERYTIESELGRGGMATVFLAVDTKVGRRVAVKVLHPELAAAVGAERFHREIQIASGLTHPHILPVHDSGETDNTLFYVMPFVEGESLRDKLRRARQLTVEETIRITCEVASALEYAHSQGIVHRDIKPENILLQNGHAIVADFGIARAITSASEGQALTQTGMSLGTPAYMSPEQGVGERMIDGRSDQYSLACVTYEMLTGQTPFTAPTLQALIARHLTEPVPLITTVRPAVPDELQDVILRALEKVPADRYATVADFASALSDAAAATGTWTRRAPGAHVTRSLRATRAQKALLRRRLALRVAAAAAAFTVLGGAALWRWPPRTHRSSSSGDVDNKRIAVLYFEDLSRDQHLGYVADGLTEGLIARLREVRSLDVVSRDGVQRYRSGGVQPDSVAHVFKAGTVVTGTVEPRGTGVRVAVRLIDGSSGDVYRRASFGVPMSAILSAGDSLAGETSRMLRPWLGEELRLREQREATSDAEAWSLLQRGERLRKEGEEKIGVDSAAAAQSLDTADSLLALTETRDPKWTEPSVLRGRIALLRAGRSRTGADAVVWIDSGLTHVARALSLDPRNADALEVRGTLRFARYSRNLAANTTEEKILLRDAEADLLKATEINPGQANAWNVLSALDYRKLDLANANIHARRALEEDAFLASAGEVLWRLYATSYDLGQSDQAVKWCAEGHRRFPANAHFVQCRLYDGLMKDIKPNVNDAWRAVREVVARTPAGDRPLAERQARMLAAAALARSGLADSARRVLLAARADKSMDPERSLLTDEALVRVRLGDHAEAVRLLKTFLSEFPQHRAGMTRNTWWWTDLKDDPDYKALIGTNR